MNPSATLATLTLRLAVALAVGGSALLAASEKGPRVQPDSALALLMEGNAHFVAGKPQHPDQTPAWREELAAGQHPFAIVLTCADSRVAPELYFDQGLGDIFVLRNAGNIIDDHIIGSIEYAVEHLGAGLIIVVGHSKCGAVAATVAGGHAPGHLGSIVESIEPAVALSAGEPGDRIDNAVRANARRMAALLGKSAPILSEAMAHGHLKVVAARYDLSSGRVELLEPQGATSAPASSSHHE
jgi:carbonic anhydrase